MTNRPIDRSHIRRILVRATNWVGDGIMTLPALEALKENFPAADLTVLARPWVAALFEAHPAVDGVLVYDAGKGPLQRLGEVLRAAGRIRRHRFDLAILFQNAFEAAFLACLGGIPFRIGYNTDGRGLLLTHPLRRDKGILGRHQVEYYLHILRAMGWEAKSRDPRLQVATGDIRGARSLLASKGIAESDVLVGLSPGAVY
ncbi:MAG: lipopolysaccharide heptosyltransferase II, partial [Deltaproteobacteria bacterium]|nr:lipopolysaccharide heptosyltransferase II [Deltaproteobacteria bacterium]